MRVRPLQGSGHFVLLLLLSLPPTTRLNVVRTGQDVDADDLAAAERALHGVRGGAPVQPSITGLHAAQGQLRGIQHPVLALGSRTERHTPRQTPQ